MPILREWRAEIRERRDEYEDDAFLLTRPGTVEHYDVREFGGPHAKLTAP